MHEQFLLAALEQARQGRGFCAPNPSVGAVAVQNGKIIAQAMHRGAGTSHAEQLLLAQITPQTPGISVYVTLEPCNHWGKTPPCVDAIIAHGIEQVVFAYKDPNPLVAENDSSGLLTAKGIQVTHFPLPEIDAFYQSYHHWILTQRPRVTAKIAQTLDGKIAGKKGEQISLSNKHCEHFTHTMRQVSDVILTSARTILHDNPQMSVRLNGNVKKKQVAILDSQLSLSFDAQIFSSASCCHIFHSNQLDEAIIAAKKSSYSNSAFYPTPLKQGKMDLSWVINHLGELGYHDVWVEAGGVIFTALHQARLVDRTYLYIVPKNLGADATSAYHDNTLFDRAHSLSWSAMDDNMLACFDWQEEPCLPD